MRKEVFVESRAELLGYDYPKVRQLRPIDLVPWKSCQVLVSLPLFLKLAHCYAGECFWQFQSCG